MDRSNDVVGSMQYDATVHRRSLEDPVRSHRRSSIPFVDRRPAVRFIRAIDQRKASISGPFNPNRGNNPDKPILKTSNFPIYVDVTELGLEGEKSNSNLSTNDELENCRCKAEVIMEKVTKADRLARGGMDLLTFPTATKRVEALSRYQGCMSISVCAIAINVSSPSFIENKNTIRKSPEANAIVKIGLEMQLEAHSLYATAKKLLSFAKIRYNEWDALLKRNQEFRVDHNKLNYPLYTHKRMPESVTLYEDALEEGTRYSVEGCAKIFRKYSDGAITLHCEVPNLKTEPIEFTISTPATQLEIIKVVTVHGKNMLYYANNNLSQSLDALQEQDSADAFGMIQRKLNGLEFDDYFDPLCALELKNSFAELVARNAELLNTTEQIYEHCKWIVNFTKVFYKYIKQSFKGTMGGCSCFGTVSKKTLLNQLGIVSVDDLGIVLPLSPSIVNNIFHMKSIIVDPEQGTEHEHDMTADIVPEPQPH